MGLFALHAVFHAFFQVADIGGFWSRTGVLRIVRVVHAREKRKAFQPTRMTGKTGKRIKNWGGWGWWWLEGWYRGDLRPKETKTA